MSLAIGFSLRVSGTTYYEDKRCLPTQFVFSYGLTSYSSGDLRGCLMIAISWGRAYRNKVFLTLDPRSIAPFRISLWHGPYPCQSTGHPEIPWKRRLVRVIIISELQQEKFEMEDLNRCRSTHDIEHPIYLNTHEPKSVFDRTSNRGHQLGMENDKRQFITFAWWPMGDDRNK